MKKILIATLLLAGCDVSYPVNGVFNGQPAQGTTTAKMSGVGTFSVYNTDGLNCHGTYDSLTMDITITAPVKCNDERTGTAIITRKSNLISGTAIVKLSDGSKGQFVFGDLSYAEEFN